MKMLEDRIRKDGIVREGNVLKVDSFINHQMDIPLFREMAKEWKRLFALVVQLVGDMLLARAVLA